MVFFSQNSTDDLEVRVTLLEDDVADLQDELEEVETANTLQDQRFDNVEDDISVNAAEIDGISALKQTWNNGCTWVLLFTCSERILTHLVGHSDRT